MTVRSFARKNPFANPDQWMDEDFDLLRERAKIYMSRKEWDRALLNLNRTLWFWGAKVPEQIDPREPPNRQSLFLRCKIRLLLSDNYNALADAQAINVDLDPSDPLFSKALSMQGDALYQMGKFEHALVIYYRGARLRKRSDPEFKLGIQKSTAAIHYSLKNIRRKAWIDINIEDTTKNQGRKH